MNTSPDTLSLKSLIENCSNSNCDQWETAWQELLNRYKKIIYLFIDKSCKGWQISRLNLQRTAVMNDIFSDVLHLLHRNIGTFENKNSEQKFVAWLQVICNRSTSRYMQKIFKNILSEENLDDFNDYKDSHSGLKSWELYENVVSMIRSLLNNNKFAERDIHIFMLNVWSGYSAKQILEHPCFKEHKLNSIEVIISRIRKKLKNFMPV